MSPVLLEVNDLKKHFPLRGSLLRPGGRRVYAVDGVSFQIDKAETLALVGESGCGKSTVGRAILRLFDITAGQVVLDGTRIDDMPAGALRPLRRRMQVVFQDPVSSLNPRMRVRDLVAEPIRNFALAKSAADMEARIDLLLEKVRLPREAKTRWPHEFSGGQRQRIAIARALAAEPDLVVCDEAVSALDVSVKAQIVNLLQELQREFGLALLFISHDLAIVEHMTHRVAVMYLGKIVELGRKRQIFGGCKHPYTEALLSAVPVPEPGAARKRVILKGDVPSPINPPKGCRFHTRCTGEYCPPRGLCGLKFLGLCLISFRSPIAANHLIMLNSLAAANAACPGNVASRAAVEARGCEIGVCKPNEKYPVR